MENSRSGVRHIAWNYSNGVPSITHRTKCAWRFSSAPFCIWPARRRNAWVCSGCFKGHGLLRRKRRSKREQFRHPTRYSSGGSAVCGTSGHATSVLGTSMSSSIRNPSPSLRNLWTFRSSASCTTVSMPCQRVREKGTSCVILPTRSPHTHLTVLKNARGTPSFGSPLNTHFGLVGRPWGCASFRYSFAGLCK